jgi:hypothetical protein
MGDVSLDEVLENIGFRDISRAVRIEVRDTFVIRWTFA